MVRALINGPNTAQRGQVIELRVLIQHPMETGYRRDSDGQTMPRNLIRSLRCQFVATRASATQPAVAAQSVFEAKLHAAVSANPLVAFHYRAQTGGRLVIEWRGDGGFVQQATHELTVT